MSTQGTPFKKRISSWSNPWLIGIGVGLFLIGLPMVLWLMTYHSDGAVVMFVITWLSMMVFVLIMAKKSLNDARFFVDQKVLDRTREEIAGQRKTLKREFLNNEIAALKRGQKTPVLDIWKLDQALVQRHTYFAAMEANLLDPESRELQMRIQIGEIDGSDSGIARLRSVLFKQLGEFLNIVLHDGYVGILRPFFATVVLQIDSLREDDRQIDVPYPILSLFIDAKTLWESSSESGVNFLHWIGTMDVRFDDGREIQVHRVIDLPAPIHR
jgi:hypothetical protein